MKRFFLFLSLIVASMQCEVVAQSTFDTIVAPYDYEEIYEGDYNYEDEDEYEEYDGNIILWELMLGVMKPQGRYGDLQDNNRFDFHMMGWYQYTLDQPFFVGLGFSYNQLQAYRADVVRSFDGVPETWKGRTNTTMFSITLGGKYIIDLRSDKVIPFVEGYLGTNLARTGTSFFLEDSEDSDSMTERLRGNIAYGGAIGVNVQVSDHVYVTGKTRYLTGLPLDYDVLDQDFDGNVMESPIEAFKVRNTSIDMLKLNLGITFVF